MPKDFTGMSIEEVRAYGSDPRSPKGIESAYEFDYRAAAAQVEAAEATKAASIATIKTADYTRRSAEYGERNAKYMLWSVIVLAIASILSFGVSVAGFLVALWTYQRNITG